MTSINQPVGKLISFIQRHNQKILAKELLPYGIGTGGQHSFLKLILNQPGITQEQMTNEMKFDKATTARSVKYLEESGYIDRRVDPNDRRSSLLYPTDKALVFAPVLQAIMDDINRMLVTDLTESEVDQLVTLLQKVARNSEALHISE